MHVLSKLQHSSLVIKGKVWPINHLQGLCTIDVNINNAIKLVKVTFTCFLVILCTFIVIIGIKFLLVIFIIHLLDFKISC